MSRLTNRGWFVVAALLVAGIMVTSWLAEVAANYACHGFGQFMIVVAFIGAAFTGARQVIEAKR